MAEAGIHFLAKFRAQMCAADCANPRRLERVDFQGVRQIRGGLFMPKL
jgi:hypothetical protein